MNKNKSKYFLLFFLIIVFVISFYKNKSLFSKDNYVVIEGESKNLNTFFPLSLDFTGNNHKSESIFNEDSKVFRKSYNINSNDLNSTKVKVKLFGKIPIKDYDVNIVERPVLVPAGQSIGVSLNTKGVLIVAITDVINKNGDKLNPAKDAGLKIGDNIIEINNVKINNSDHIVDMLNSSKEEEITMKVLRNGKELKINATPVRSLQDNAFRLGIWVRDKTTGIGTLTYYNTESFKFGALGHGITDIESGNLLTVEKGLITEAKVSDIQQGVKGIPGEIKGVFYKTDEVVGDIVLNNEFGIYGNIRKNILTDNLSKPMPIAFSSEVKKGKAHILTTLEDNKVEKFEIEIIKLETQNEENQKSMVVKIVDPKLLKRTGGIVQGMSGSPIIQNDKIIGAITHVFINEPTKGYGLYIEWMLNQEDKF